MKQKIANSTKGFAIFLTTVCTEFNTACAKRLTSGYNICYYEFGHNDPDYEKDNQPIFL